MRGADSQNLRGRQRGGVRATGSGSQIRGIGEEHADPALRAADLALSGRRQREASRFASIELRFPDSRTGPWEAAAMASVAVAALLVVLGLWFL